MTRISRSFFALLASFIFILSANAQIDIDINLGGKEWYEEPWAWAAGVVILLLILLLLRKPRK